ncbi:hypothetical protein BBJ28_00019746 [Nothophytophthora sp. Chile5]|nr:hypothetical protein BBJ28_00019746 [Nothophytophthora sp. Chile5]
MTTQLTREIGACNPANFPHLYMYIEAIERMTTMTATKQWSWEDDDVAGPLVQKLLGGAEAWETRAFLRPIFRWMKLGVHKDGNRDAEPIEKAFAFVEWMVLLATQGDAARGIPALPLLQPSYALNTIVTASQRAGSVIDAQRAFNLLGHYGYEPDVFTYTALIDVIARNGNLPAAIEVGFA